jgi:predicted transcriptional regulator
MSRLRSANQDTSLNETEEEQDREITYVQENIYGVNRSGVATLERGEGNETANGETTD